MGKARKCSLDIQHKEVSLEGKARKASRISNIKRLVWCNGKKGNIAQIYGTK